MTTEVVFATPSSSASVCLEFLSSSLSTEALIWKYGMKSAYKWRSGDAYLSKVRNKLASEFLTDHPNATDLFFLDDDIGWPAQKVIEFLQRPELVLAGVYPKKSDDPDYPCEIYVNPKGQIESQSGLIKAMLVPTGFLRIKRQVIQMMAEQSQVFTDWESDGKAHQYWDIFQMGRREDGRWWGEDYYFCDKWLGMGGEIWVDPDINFTHRGTKKYSGNMSQNLQAIRDRAAAGLKEVA